MNIDYGIFSGNESIHVTGEFCCDSEIETLLHIVRKNTEKKLGDVAKVTLVRFTYTIFYREYNAVFIC